jgi:hypothetical protein
VLYEGGTVIRLDGCRSAAGVAEAVAWLDAVGVSVHRVVELPTDSASPAHDIADEVNLTLVGRR